MVFSSSVAFILTNSRLDDSKSLGNSVNYLKRLREITWYKLNIYTSQFLYPFENILKTTRDKLYQYKSFSELININLKTVPSLQQIHVFRYFRIDLISDFKIAGVFIC